MTRLFVCKTGIGANYRSDHSSNSLSIKCIDQQKGKGTWKFNNSLLNDLDYVGLVKKCIGDFIDIYATNPEEEDINLITFSISDKLLWETLKLMIRGKTIAYSSYKKRERDKLENDLELKLEKLQQEER